MTHSRLRHISPLLALLLVVGIALGACSSDDDSDDGDAPTTTTTEASSGDDADADATETTAAADNPYAAAIEEQAAEVGIVSVREEGDARILVMEDGSTTDDVEPACTLAATLLPEGTEISADVAGEVIPCP